MHPRTAWLKSISLKNRSHTFMNTPRLHEKWQRARWCLPEDSVMPVRFSNTLVRPPLAYGWNGGPTDLDDLDDSPINLVLHSQSRCFEMLDLSDPPAHGHACETPDILRHSEVTKETLQSKQVTNTSNDFVEFTLTRPHTNNCLCTGQRTEGVCANHRAWSESEFPSTKLASS